MTSEDSIDNLKEKENHECQLCGNTFKKENYLQAHISNVHTGNKFPCDVCSKIFKTKTELKSHFGFVHLKSKRFECSHCQKHFFFFR